MKLFHFIHKHKCNDQCNHPYIDNKIKDIRLDFGIDQEHIYFISSCRDLQDEYIPFKNLNTKFHSKEIFYNVDRNNRKHFKYGIEPLFVYNNDSIMKKLYPLLISDYNYIPKSKIILENNNLKFNNISYVSNSLSQNDNLINDYDEIFNDDFYLPKKKLYDYFKTKNR